MVPSLDALAAGKSSTKPSTNPSAPSAARVAKTDQGLILNFQNETVDVILEELCQTLGLKLAKDVKINNRISVVSPNPISAEETWALINVLVEQTGLKVVQVGLEVKLILNEKRPGR
jgi:hypothetical protein